MPAPASSFKVVSSSTPTTGTFPSQHAVIAATYSGTYDPYGNGGSAGLFNADYTNGVTLSNFHQVNVLSFGVLDTKPGENLYGYNTANAVHDAFAKLPGVVHNALDATHSITASGSTPNGAADLTTDLNNAAAKVRAGDTFVFYINTHGTYGSNPANIGGEAPVHRQTTSPPYTEPSTKQTELYLSATDPSQNLTASQFTSIFSSNPKWQGVNKLFVIDTCYAGGFWGNPGGDGYPEVKYLSSLDHAAIIAASPENLFSYSRNNSGGALGQALAMALASFNGQDITFDTLRQQLVVAEDSLFEQSSGWSYQSPIDGIGDLSVTPTVSFITYATSDFNLGLAGGAVPEPSSLSLLALGAIGLLRRRRAA